MAQISKGIRLGYGIKAGATRPDAYAFIPELTGIPALSASPSTHDRTTLMDSVHRYIKGLVDVGGNLDFPCIFTNDIIDSVESAIALQNAGNTLEWCVEFPEPLGRRSYFTGEASAVYNESVDVDAPLTGSLSLVPTSIVVGESADYLVVFDSNDGSVVADQVINYVQPTAPTLDTFTFNGWFTDDVTFVNEFSFGTTKIEGDLTLYAEWL
jgi:uncharacterized repeat protein (TIGR02543 family)